MQSVLCMYDVRGIQAFIFRSNRIKEIVGASHIVDNLLTDFFRAEFRRKQAESGQRYLCDWYDEDDQGKRTPRDYQFDAHQDVAAELLNFGGGNMLVAFRDSEVAKEMNRALSAWIVEATYSLSVAIAMVPITSDYQGDYRNLKQVMAQVKQENNSMQPHSGFPFTREEVGSGFPLAARTRVSGAIREVSTETHRKLSAYESRPKDRRFEANMDKIIDSQSGERMVALVHIDGNEIGRQLPAALSEQRSYAGAVNVLRAISTNFHNCFCVAGMQAILEKLDQWSANDESVYAFRPIILAGMT